MASAVTSVRKRCRLTRLRRSDNSDVACGSGQVDDQWRPTLLKRTVNDPDRNCQRGHRFTVGQQGAQARRCSERRQPHFMRSWAVSRQPLDDGLEDGATIDRIRLGVAGNGERPDRLSTE